MHEYDIEITYDGVKVHRYDSLQYIANLEDFDDLVDILNNLLKESSLFYSDVITMLYKWLIIKSTSTKILFGIKYMIDISYDMKSTYFKIRSE